MKCAFWLRALALAVSHTVNILGVHWYDSLRRAKQNPFVKTILEQEWWNSQRCFKG